MKCTICGMNSEKKICPACEDLLGTDTKTTPKKQEKKVTKKEVKKENKKEVSLTGFLEFLLSKKEKYVISPKHNKQRILDVIAEYEETTK